MCNSLEQHRNITTRNILQGHHSIIMCRQNTIRHHSIIHYDETIKVTKEASEEEVMEEEDLEEVEDQ
jgi:hypothetical protein